MEKELPVPYHRVDKEEMGSSAGGGYAIPVALVETNWK